MRHFAFAVGLMCTAFVAQADAPDCAIRDIRNFAQDFAAAYEKHTLQSLDDRYCPGQSLDLRIEDGSCDECPDQIRHFKKSSFTAIAELLKSRSKGELPFPGVWPLEYCKSNRCVFGGEEAHLQHFHLFLKEIRYRKRKGRYYITSIFFEDGM